MPAAFNLGLVMRHAIGVGTPRGLQGRAVALLLTLLACMRRIRRRLTVISRWPRPRTTLCRRGPSAPTRFNAFEIMTSVAVGTAVIPPPPAQIRTGRIAAYGSYLGCVASKRTFG